MGRLHPYFNTSEAIRPVLRLPPMAALRALSLAVILVAAVLAGCEPDIEKRGELPERSEIAQIHPGTTTRTEVAKLLGSPSSTGIFDPNHWYYISRETKQVSFFDPDVLDQQVYVISFDGNGIVTSVEHKTLQDAENVPMAPGATPAPGRELTFMEQLLGNIGRFGGGSAPEGSPGLAASTNQERPTNLVGPP
ncbi:MAG TPA: outer membrane protein assembly factor BamE [Stellaceae bacterium]|nr:outer membrane protein assembly factor BamE [Stellaceae bacterium]